MINAIASLDRSVTSAISNAFPRNAFFDDFFSFFSFRGNFLFVWILVLTILMVLWTKKYKGFWIIFLVSVGLTLVSTNIALKNLFDRARPEFIGNHGLFCPSDFSFPSGHAATAFAIAALFAYTDKKRRLLYYGIASLVAVSRIYLGCHFFLDVLGGAFVGYLISSITISLMKNFRT